MRFAFITFLLVSCGSSGLVSQAIEGGPGQPISVDIGGAETGMVSDTEGNREYELQIEVSDDSDVTLTVTRITVMTEGSGAFQLQTVSRKFNEMIDPGKDHVFDVRVMGRLVRAFQRNEPKVALLRVIIELSNGDSYFYTFEGPVRRTP